MATWQEVSRDCLQAAKMLAGEGYWRSSVSRSSYAAYCAVTSDLVARGVRFGRGWHNPPHEHLLHLMTHTLTLPQDVRRRLSRRLRTWRHAREDADDRPGMTVNRAMALHGLRDAMVVLQDVGVQDASGEETTQADRCRGGAHVHQGAASRRCDVRGHGTRHPHGVLLVVCAGASERGAGATVCVL